MQSDMYEKVLATNSKYFEAYVALAGWLKRRFDESQKAFTDPA